MSPKKTPEQELEELKNKELMLKEQIKQPDSFLRNLYSSAAPKKDVIALWAMNLERQYDLENTLGYTPVVKSVGLISSYIKDELRSMGVHASTFSYVHEVLGYKYKNGKYDTSEKDDLEGDVEHRLNSSNLIANYPKENTSILETIHQQIEFLKNFRTKAKSSRMLIALTPTQLLKYEETNLRIQSGILYASQIIDDRQSVPMVAQLKLVMAIVGTTNSFAAGMYVSQIKQYGATKMEDAQHVFEKTTDEYIMALPKKTQKEFSGTLKNIAKMRKNIQKIEKKKKKKKNTRANLADVMTPKQAMKIVFGLVKKVLPVFDHHSKRGNYGRDAAILDGFYGIACPDCGSYRVREKEDREKEWLCYCFDCEWQFEAYTVIKCWECHLPFFEDILEVILKTSSPVLGPKGEELGAKTSKCPRCENDLILPAKMFVKPVLRGK